MARVEVTEASLRDYLLSRADASNYHLLYGLSLLSDPHFGAVVDALLNGEAQPEDLVRLGSFSAAEAEAFVRMFLSTWDRAGLALPGAGTAGWTYLADELGFSTLLAEVSQTLPPVRPSFVLEARVTAGDDWSPTVTQACATFRDRALPDVLDQVGYSSLTELLSPPEDEKAAVWVQGAFAPLLDPAFGPDDALTALFAVGPSEGLLRRNPGLAQFIVSDTRPHPASQLLMQREAAERSSAGRYTPAWVNAALDAIEGVRLKHYTTGVEAARLDFGLQVSLAAARAESGEEWEAVLTRATALLDSLDAVFAYRDRLRSFVLAARRALPLHLAGSYPV